jgi:hypothetical protein
MTAASIQRDFIFAFLAAALFLAACSCAGHFLAMNSRRLMASTPRAQKCADCRLQGRDYSRELRLAKWGSGVSLHRSNLEPPMSALGQKRTLERLYTMSALPPRADMDKRGRDVRLVPI